MLEADPRDAGRESPSPQFRNGPRRPFAWSDLRTDRTLESGVSAMVAEIFGLDGAVVAVIAVAVLFGAKRLPEMARSIGRAQGEFKKGVREGHVEDPTVGPGPDVQDPGSP
jgi:sec-independent protein translocase protein TatA